MIQTELFNQIEIQSKRILELEQALDQALVMIESYVDIRGNTDYVDLCKTLECV